MSYVPPINREIQDFYRNHVDAVYRSCCFLTGGQGNAQAMTRDVFLKLLGQGLEFSSDKDARAWMLLTACRLAKKKEYFAPEAPVQSVPETPPEEPEISEPADETVQEEPAAVQNPESEAARNEQEEPQPAQIPEQSAAPEQQETAPGQEAAPEQQVEAVAIQDVYAEIRKLSRKNRLIALLYYCEGYRKSEIANYLGCLDMVVKARLKQVKKVIQDDMGGDE